MCETIRFILRRRPREINENKFGLAKKSRVERNFTPVVNDRSVKIQINRMIGAEELLNWLVIQVH